MYIYIWIQYRKTAGVGDSVVLVRSWTWPKSVWLSIERQLVALSSLLLSSSQDVFQPSAMAERSPCSFCNLKMIWFCWTDQQEPFLFSFLFVLFRYPTQSLLKCLRQDAVSLTHKMIRQLQLCLVWLVFWQVMTASRCSFATPVPWRHRACLAPLQDVSTRFRYFLVRWSIYFILLHRRMWLPSQDISCVIRSSRMASMSWKALLAARHCVATPVLLSRRENRFGAMVLFHCSTIGLNIDIFISYHNRYFITVIFNIRVSIRVRGLHLVFSDIRPKALWFSPFWR